MGLERMLSRFFSTWENSALGVIHPSVGTYHKEIVYHVTSHAENGPSSFAPLMEKRWP